MHTMHSGEWGDAVLTGGSGQSAVLVNVCDGGLALVVRRHPCEHTHQVSEEGVQHVRQGEHAYDKWGFVVLTEGQVKVLC
jgi:hypothetical protein